MSEDQQTPDSSQRSHPGVESGVAGLKLYEILELKSRQNFHGLLVVQYEKQTAKIYFDQGTLQHAITPEHDGEQAIRDVLSWQGGKIKVLPQMTYPRRTIEKSLDDLLIETGHKQSSPLLPSRQSLPLPAGAAKVVVKPHSGRKTQRTSVAMIAGGVLLLVAFMTMGAYLLLPASSKLSSAHALIGMKTQTPRIISKVEETSPQPIWSAPETILTLQGSNTIGSDLAPQLAKEYLSSKGATQISIKVTAPEEVIVSGYFPAEKKARAIVIKAHGSSTSFAGLRTHACDIGMASRRIKDEERLQLAPEGDMTRVDAENVLAMDGVAVVVHPANQLVALSIEQLAGLFSGTIRDWSEIAQSGLTGPVKIYARDDKSGTYDTFKALVLKPNKMKLSTEAQRFEDSQKLSDLVSKDANGIGFIGLPYISPSKVLAVQEKGTKPVFPTAFTIATEDYPLSRRLYFYLPPKSASSTARDFIAFATSDEGQTTAAKVGFVKLSVFEQKRSLIGQTDVPSEYAKMSREAHRLSVNFRFHSGGDKLDNKAIQDLSRIVDYLSRESNRNRGISLFGFADNLGQYEKNCEISLERARKVEEALAAFGVFSSNTQGLCDSIPVASNFSSNGRNKNRRVEVWVN